MLDRAAADDPHDSHRIEQWAGEARTNLVRLAAIVIFYGHHLINLYWFGDEASGGEYHLQVSLLTVTWAALVAVLYLVLQRRYLPSWLPFVAMACDLVLATMLLGVVRDPKTTLAVVFFVIIASAPLRLSLPLVYFATLGAMLGYGVFLWFVRYWFEIPEPQRLSRPHQIAFVLGLAVCGLLAGQSVRQGRRLLRGYPVSAAD